MDRNRQSKGLRQLSHQWYYKREKEFRGGGANWWRSSG
ncbi:hypothetical protein BVRB_6g133610 [Beta vulgaris subsp. vulgaris]|nr:hypothetical protein BVRB_6g133610 [Beta vulgaris subsp. vulgaris]